MLYSATSTTWQVSGFNDFTKGKLSGLSLSMDGILQLGPSTKFVADLGAPSAWTTAPAPDGGIYVGTGHNGKVVHVSPDGKTSVVWTAPQPEVFALCAGAGQALYAGTSPNGAVYRIENGQAKEIWRSPDKYIWALIPAADGGLYAGTGEQGSVYRIQSDGTAELYYDTGQPNITSLSTGPQGRLYAGTDPNGLLYEITAKGKATVLFDSSLPEIRSLAVAPDGTLYAAGMGGAVSTRTPGGATSSPAPAAGAVTASSPTVITVTEAANTDQQTAAAPPAQGTAPSSTSSATANPAQTGVVEVSGVDKSAIYKISPERAVETLRTSKEENVYELRLEGDALLFATDVRGRLYRWSAGKTMLLSELADGETTRLLSGSGVVFAVMSNPARVFGLAPPGTSGSYESQVHDSVSVARWGHLHWHGTGSGISFQTRTGFSARPDSTWSSWASVEEGTLRITSPPARFIQFRTQWERGSDAQINSVDIPYLPQNGRPAIHSITVTSVVEQNPAKSGSTSASTANTPYSITVTDTGEAPAASTGSSTNQTASHLQTSQTQVSWQADDPDGDKLVYSVYFRAEEAKDWQLVRSRMFENTLLLDPDVFADGRYFFRVVASDSPANAAAFAQEAELVSAPVLIDNTPPEVTIGSPQRNGTTLDVDVKAADRTSPLRLCEYSLDAGSWQPIESTDGVTDSPEETFHLHLEKLRPGEHLLVFRVYDTANNAGLGKVILR
jgi:sugar lactone lactonase YvrE